MLIGGNALQSRKRSAPNRAAFFKLAHQVLEDWYLKRGSRGSWRPDMTFSAVIQQASVS